MGDQLMMKYLYYLFGDHHGGLRSKIIFLYILLISFNITVWCWAFYSLHSSPFLISTSILAYTFGLRHAVDADHIAAIDNVTRKLMQEGKQPVLAGLFFSLGHSTVVLLASIGVALTSATLVNNRFFQRWHEIGGVVCTSISALFLLIIAMTNLMIFISIYQLVLKAQRQKQYKEEDLNVLAAKRGFLTKHFSGLFQVITHSWQMYPLGFVFGMGFDTATEIALLGIGASQAINGLSIWSILIFPALFTAGMTLIDATDSIIMLGAYEWAFMKPIRKLYYNLTITFMSIIVAFGVGSIEALGLIASKISTENPVWNLIRNLNDHFSNLGYIIIIIFIITWLLSIIIYKFMYLDRREIE